MFQYTSNCRTKNPERQKKKKKTSFVSNFCNSMRKLLQKLEEEVKHKLDNSMTRWQLLLIFVVLAQQILELMSVLNFCRFQLQLALTAVRVIYMNKLWIKIVNEQLEPYAIKIARTVLRGGMPKKVYLSQYIQHHCIMGSNPIAS